MLPTILFSYTLGIFNIHKINNSLYDYLLYFDSLMPTTYVFRNLEQFINKYNIVIFDYHVNWLRRIRWLIKFNDKMDNTN